MSPGPHGQVAQLGDVQRFLVPGLALSDYEVMGRKHSTVVADCFGRLADPRAELGGRQRPAVDQATQHVQPYGVFNDPPKRMAHDFFFRPFGGDSRLRVGLDLRPLSLGDSNPRTAKVTGTHPLPSPLA